MTLKFYQALPSDIQVLSFDLDDTLYQNGDVIRNAEQAQLDAVCELIPKVKETGLSHWRELKWQVAKSNPELCHDVSQWRLAVIKKGLAEFGIENESAIAQVYDAFYQARSNFLVPTKTFDILAQLTTKYRLIAVTNGNVDINKVGLAEYFSGYYRAGEQDCRMKPHPDMLNKAVSDLSLAKPEQVLHIGDSVSSDIKAAQNAGMANLWFNPNGAKYPTGFALPTGEYSDLSDLLALL